MRMFGNLFNLLQQGPAGRHVSNKSSLYLMSVPQRGISDEYKALLDALFCHALSSLVDFPVRLWPSTWMCVCICIRVEVAAGTVPQAGFKPTFPRFSLMKSSGRERGNRGRGEMWKHKKERNLAEVGARGFTPKTKNRRAWYVRGGLVVCALAR